MPSNGAVTARRNRRRATLPGAAADPWQTAARPVGSSLAISASGKLCGSVSGGCVENDVYEQAQSVLETGEPKLLSYGISDDEAWSVGLPCGGEIDVFVEKLQ